MAYSAALGSDDFDDWWSALVKSVSADDNRKGYEAADRLENHKDFTSKISDKEITVGQYSYNGKYYVAYQKARCGLLSNPDKKDVMWRYCRDWTLENGWGKYIAGNMYSSNPIKGFVDALCQNKDIPLGDTLDRLESLYNKSGEFADMPSYSGKKDVAYTAVKLIEARENEVSQQQKDIWNGRI